MEILNRQTPKQYYQIPIVGLTNSYSKVPLVDVLKQIEEQGVTPNEVMLYIHSSAQLHINRTDEQLIAAIEKHISDLRSALNELPKGRSEV